MSASDAWIELRRSERVDDRARPICDFCGKRNPTTYLYSENVETGDKIYMCGTCAAHDEIPSLEASGHKVDCVVLFNGKKTEGCFPFGWFTSDAYGVLLKDGRIMFGGREVKPESYTRVP